MFTLKYANSIPSLIKLKIDRIGAVELAQQVKYWYKYEELSLNP